MTESSHVFLQIEPNSVESKYIGIILDGTVPLLNSTRGIDKRQANSEFIVRSKFCCLKPNVVEPSIKNTKL